MSKGRYRTFEDYNGMNGVKNNYNPDQISGGSAIRPGRCGMGGCSVKSFENFEPSKGTLEYLKSYAFDGNLRLKGQVPYYFVMIQSKNCGYCQQAKPDFEKLAGMFQGHPQIRIATIQADQERDLYMKLSQMKQLQGVPAYFLFKDGYITSEYSGDRSIQDMIDFLRQNIR